MGTTMTYVSHSQSPLKAFGTRYIPTSLPLYQEFSSGFWKKGTEDQRYLPQNALRFREWLHREDICTVSFRKG